MTGPPLPPEELGGDPPCWAHLDPPTDDERCSEDPGTPSIRTALTERLSIEHPVLLAPMGDVAGGELAAAVSRAGGLGLVGGGYADPAWLERELEAAGDAPVGVGFITFALDEQPEALDLALEHGARTIQLSFGDPTPHVRRVHDAGAVLICQVQTLDEAQRVADLGADIIVAQGQDSGGHGRSGRGTMSLVPAAVDAVSPIPVVAAGGIADGRGLAAALVLGAAGITLGTRLLASREAISDPIAEGLLTTNGGDDTVRTEAFDVVRGPPWPEGCDGRALRNTITAQWDDARHDAAAIARLRERYDAAPQDDYGFRVLWAGEALDIIHSIEPAATIVRAIVAEAAQRLRSAPDAVCAVDQP